MGAPWHIVVQQVVQLDVCMRCMHEMYAREGFMPCACNAAAGVHISLFVTTAGASAMVLQACRCRADSNWVGLQRKCLGPMRLQECSAVG